jgi:hypothetical protein
MALFQVQRVYARLWVRHRNYKSYESACIAMRRLPEARVYAIHEPSRILAERLKCGTVVEYGSPKPPPPATFFPSFRHGLRQA